MVPASFAENQRILQTHFANGIIIYNSLCCVYIKVKLYLIKLFILKWKFVMSFSDFEINQLSKHNKNCLIVWLTSAIMDYVFNGIINIIEVEISIVKITIFDV